MTNVIRSVVGQRVNARQARGKRPMSPKTFRTSEVPMTLRLEPLTWKEIADDEDRETGLATAMENMRL